MQFHSFESAADHYARRYAEYTAGRLTGAQLQAEREAIVVTDRYGARWGMDQWGRWTPRADAGGRSVPRWLLVTAPLLAIALFATAGLVATRGEAPGPVIASAAPTVAATPLVPAATPGSEQVTAAPVGGPIGGLVGDLRVGGFVLYLRHAARTKVEDRVTDPSDCSQQANLTDEGRAQATAIGEAFRALEIPVGPVYASPYCRTTETAQLAFGEVTAVPELAGGTSDPPIDPAAQRDVLNRLLGTSVAGANVVVVGHSEVIEAVTGEVTDDFAETVVFQPQPVGAYRVVDHVEFAELVGWVESCPPQCS